MIVNTQEINFFCYGCICTILKKISNTMKLYEDHTFSKHLTLIVNVKQAFATAECEVKCTRQPIATSAPPI